ncbi:MAG: hypothetical protein ACPGJS_03085 [Flammeovirgaceae bacterium]
MKQIIKKLFPPSPPKNKLELFKQIHRFYDELSDQREKAEKQYLKRHQKLLTQLPAWKAKLEKATSLSSEKQQQLAQELSDWRKKKNAAYDALSNLKNYQATLESEKKKLVNDVEWAPSLSKALQLFEAIQLEANLEKVIHKTAPYRIESLLGEVKHQVTTSEFLIQAYSELAAEEAKRKKYINRKND